MLSKYSFCVSSGEESVVLIKRELNHVIKGCELHTRMMEEAEIFPCSLTFAFHA